MAGALHQHAKTWRSPPEGAIKAWDAELMCGIRDRTKNGIYILAPEAVEPVERLYLGLTHEVATLDANEIGLINADLGLHNVLWHRGRAGLVDFNDAGVGPYAFCLARLVGRMRWHEDAQTLVEDLLSGYREVTPLPSAYEKSGDLFELATDVFRVCYYAARALSRGMPLQEPELRFVGTLGERLDRLGL
jgi:Ser/Thr protein kinase RdoA (MazF antagonist)